MISGDLEAVDDVLARLTEAGVTARRLDVSHAFHSHRLDPMLDAFERRAASTNCAAPRITLLSNVTGAAFSGTTRPDAAYWRRHARDAVRFAQCLETLRASGSRRSSRLGRTPRWWRWLPAWRPPKPGDHRVTAPRAR